jgi:IS30 family transposase
MIRDYFPKDIDFTKKELKEVKINSMKDHEMY